MRSITLEMAPEECRSVAEEVRGCKPELTDPMQPEVAEAFALYLEALARRLSADAQPA